MYKYLCQKSGGALAPLAPLFPPPMSFFIADDHTCDLKEPTTYELESRSMVAGWNEIRESAIKAITETAAIPLKQQCVNCDSLASLRCHQCGPLGFYCQGCFQIFHKCVNFLHIPEKCEVNRVYCKNNLLLHWI